MYKLNKFIVKKFNDKADIKVNISEVFNNDGIYKVEQQIIDLLETKKTIRLKLYEDAQSLKNDKALNSKDDYEKFYNYLIAHHVHPYHLVIEEISKAGYYYYYLTVTLVVYKDDVRCFLPG